jgi:outer membrane protein OmpA-like peptidoglycan-associated protein
MKKFMIALAIASLGTVAANAQSRVFAQNSFWSNWFVQVGVDMSLANPSQASEWFDNVFPNGKSFGVDVAVGKWFSPSLGLRAKVQWENGLLENKHQNFKGNYNPYQWVPNYDAGGYGMVAGDVMFNLSNLICGYNESRVWNFIPYLGAGVLRSFEYQEYTPALRTGIENTWKLGKRVNIFLDVDYTWTTGAFVGGNDVHSVEHADPANHHGILQTELGVQFNLGKTNWDEAISPAEYERMKAEYEAKIRQYEAEIAKLRADNDRLKKELDKLKADYKKLQDENDALKKQIAALQQQGNQGDNMVSGGQSSRTVFAGTATSVFFERNSSEINSEKDMVNLKSIAEVAKANPSMKIRVVGSADSATGTPEINQRLSENRAATVAQALVDMDVENEIIQEARGGIAESDDNTLDRRVVVSFE